MSGVTPGLVVLGAVKRQDAQAMKGKPLSSSPSWHLYQLLSSDAYLELLFRLPWMMDCQL